MNRVLPSAAAVMMVLTTATLGMTWTNQTSKEIIGLSSEQVPWFTPSHYKDGRQRAKLIGDSSEGGAWVERLKIPGGMRALSHTHPHDEQITVIEGTWHLGNGERFDSTKLKGYPAGSFIVIPAGVPHFVATKDGPVIVQVSGTGKARTDYLEK